MPGHGGEDLVSNRYALSSRSQVENVAYVPETVILSCEEVDELPAKEVRLHLVGGSTSCLVPKMT